MLVVRVHDTEDLCFGLADLALLDRLIEQVSLSSYDVDENLFAVTEMLPHLVDVTLIALQCELTRLGNALLSSFSSLLTNVSADARLLERSWGSFEALLLLFAELHVLDVAKQLTIAEGRFDQRLDLFVDVRIAFTHLDEELVERL